MYSIASTTSRQYPQRFQEIYSLSKQFSAKLNVSFDEVFTQAVKFHDPQYSSQQIWDQLQINGYRDAKMNVNTANKNYSVWLTFGETGQGKSTFTNAICGTQTAVEGKGIKSKTENIGLHTSTKNQVIMIDTPGLFDTRRIKNKEISNQVIEIVQEKLKENAHIDAIFFLWCPTSSMRLRFEEILTNLRKALGDGAINSIVFVVNKVSQFWTQDYDQLYDEFLDLLDENNLENPVVQCDLKQMTIEDMKELKKSAAGVSPYRDQDFETHRMMIYFQKFLEIQRIDEEKKKEREQIEKEVGTKFDKRANEMETKFKQDAQQMEEKFTHDLKKQEAESNEKNKKLQEEYKSEVNGLKKRGDDLESQMRQEKEKAQKEAEKRAAEERRNKEEAQRMEQRLKDDLRRQEADNAQKNMILQQQYQAEMETLRQQSKQLETRLEKEKAEREAEERKRKEDEERRRQEDQRRRIEEQRRREDEARASQSYSYSPPTFISAPSYSLTSPGFSSTVYQTPVSTSTTSEMKFYGGGQFIPGGGHAPKGGCYMPVSNSQSRSVSSVSSVSSTNSGGGGGTFYKGGQFMPGGGRAPKGGAYG